jgi:uncharacterized protein YecT (DUF1311 family)
MKNKQKMFLFFGSMLFSFYSYSASFDCAKVSTDIERQICGNKKLSDLDETLGNLYKSIMEKTPAPEDSKMRQRDWIKGWRNTCKDMKCLENAYSTRIVEVEKELKNYPFIPSFEKPILVFPLIAPTKFDPKISNKEAFELIGRIAFNHDAAGGKYDIVSGKRNLTIRYVWDISDDQKDILIKLENSNQFVVLRSNLVTYQDGSKGIDTQSVVKIFGMIP